MRASRCRLELDKLALLRLCIRLAHEDNMELYCCDTLNVDAGGNLGGCGQDFLVHRSSLIPPLNFDWLLGKWKGEHKSILTMPVVLTTDTPWDTSVANSSPSLHQEI